jgi:hypothetical protein
MVCSCFFFQRVLVGCRCILAVKNRVVDVYEDVFWHHLIKYSLGLLPFCERRIDDGLMNGPGVSGVDPKQLQVAIEQTPASRDGVNAWIREGGLSWAPNSRVVWGKISVTSSIAESKSGSHDPAMSDLKYDRRPDPPGAVPQYVRTGTQMYRYFVDNVEAWARTQGTMVSRSTNRENFEETMRVVDKWQKELVLVLQPRYGKYEGPSNTGGVYDGFRPASGGIDKRRLGAGESRRKKRRQRQTWGAFDPSNGSSPPPHSRSRTHPIETVNEVAHT